MPLLALMAGAVGIGFAAIFAKLAVNADRAAGGEMLSPAAVAFWRMFLATPFFALPLFLRKPGGPPRPKLHWILLVPGFVFALDLAVWHWSFEFTSVANATLEANFAVVIVAFVSWFWLGERLKPIFAVGAALALVGMSLLVGASFGAGGDAWIGDLMGCWAAVAYAAYQIATKFVLKKFDVATVMAAVSVSGAASLAVFAVASPGRFFPSTGEAWLAIVALTLVSQVFGQGLIAYGLKRTPAAFASVVLILQPVTAAVLGWWMLDQPLTSGQALAALLTLAGIYIARLGSLGRASPS